MMPTCACAMRHQTGQVPVRRRRLETPRVHVLHAQHPKIYWLVLDGPTPELCYDDPGRLIDLVVAVDEEVFGAVLIGRASFGGAVDDGAIRLEGSPELVRAFPSWLWPSQFARYIRPTPIHSTEPAAPPRVH